MVWGGLPGSGDMLMNSGDTLVTGQISAQQVTANHLKTGNMSLSTVHVQTAVMVAPAANLLLGFLTTNVASARGCMLIKDVNVAGLSPAPGNNTLGGWLYVQSGGLHFMGTAGTITVVGSP